MLLESLNIPLTMTSKGKNKQTNKQNKKQNKTKQNKNCFKHQI